MYSDSGYGWRLIRALLRAAFFLPIEPTLAKRRLSGFHEHKHALRDMAHSAALMSRMVIYAATDGVGRCRSSSYSGPPSPIRSCCLPCIPHFPTNDIYPPLRSRCVRREGNRFRERSKEWWEMWVAAHEDNVCAFDELGVIPPSSRAEAQELSRAALSVSSRILRVRHHI